MNRSICAERANAAKSTPADPTCQSVGQSIICSEIYEFARGRQRGLLRTNGVWEIGLTFLPPDRSRASASSSFISNARCNARPRITFRVINCRFPYNFSITHVRNYLFRVSATLPFWPFYLHAVEGSSWFMTRFPQALHDWGKWMYLRRKNKHEYFAFCS